MEHIITITKETFFKYNYIDNQKCPLAVTLRGYFKGIGKNVEYINVGGYDFLLDDKNILISSCVTNQPHLIEGKFTSDVSEIIADYAMQEDIKNIEDLTFSFLYF